MMMMADPRRVQCYYVNEGNACERPILLPNVCNQFNEKVRALLGGRCSQRMVDRERHIVCFDNGVEQVYAQLSARHDGTYVDLLTLNVFMMATKRSATSR